MTRLAFLQKHFEKEDGAKPGSDLSKHLKMTTSPFVFYRGSAPLFYADIQSQVLTLSNEMRSLPEVYVMGDCHASNFGFFSEEGSHSGSVIFAPNDFDDACVGNACWDLLLFCTSLHLCQAHCEQLFVDTGKPIVSRFDVDSAIDCFLQSYHEQCQAALINPLAINDAIERIAPTAKLHKFYEKAKHRATGGDDFAFKSTLAKATFVDGKGQLKFIENTDKFVPLDTKMYEAIKTAFSPYMDDTVCDIVKRVGAGTGSVNLERYYFLVGPGERESSMILERYHIVEVKQQKLASPLRYNLSPHPVNTLNPAHLTARCQRHMQRNPDLLLDEVEWQDKHWLIRSRHHAKVGLDPEDIGVGKKNVNFGFRYFAELCGQSLALAHCRSARRGMAFEQQWVDNHIALIDGLIALSCQYALQVKGDFELFCGSYLAR